MMLTLLLTLLDYQQGFVLCFITLGSALFSCLIPRHMTLTAYPYVVKHTSEERPCQEENIIAENMTTLPCECHVFTWQVLEQQHYKIICSKNKLMLISIRAWCELQRLELASRLTDGDRDCVCMYHMAVHIWNLKSCKLFGHDRMQMDHTTANTFPANVDISYQAVNICPANQLPLQYILLPWRHIQSAVLECFTSTKPSQCSDVHHLLDFFNFFRNHTVYLMLVLCCMLLLSVWLLQSSIKHAQSSSCF